MRPFEEFRIAQHNSLQELANHYNSINWNLHTIFVPLHVALVGYLGISGDSLWKDGLKGVVIGLTRSIVGWFLANAWQCNYERHKRYIRTLYTRLQAIETSLSSGGEDLETFKVHLLMQHPANNSSATDSILGNNVPTHNVILGIQTYLKFAYILIGIVALVRALLLFFP